MGRLLKRVPLDFTYQMGEIWEGYINPYQAIECSHCEGIGYNEATAKLDKDWYAFDNPRYVYISNDRRYNANAWKYHLTEVEVLALMKEGRLTDLMGFRVFFDEKLNSWFKWVNGVKVECDVPKMPTPQEVNDWAIHSLGHDSLNRMICVEARAKSLGVYGHCAICGGDGCLWENDETKLLYENWEKVEPPVGNGFQLWEDTSEGSPESPVFGTLDELCEYLEREKISVFAGKSAKKEEWKDMLDGGVVVYKDGGVVYI